MIGIYKITNKNNGKVYIGQSNNVERRLSEHKQKRTQTIDNIINVLGVENFDFEIVEECNQDDLDKKEKEYIEKYDSVSNGYNIQKGGVNNSIGEGNGRARVSEKVAIISLLKRFMKRILRAKSQKTNFKLYGKENLGRISCQKF